MTLRIALLVVLTNVAGCQFSVAEAMPLATQPPGNGQPATVNFKPHEFKALDGTIVPAELGEFQVPENRTKPDSRKITIRFVRFKSTAAKPGAPIVYLAGGPGGSGIGSAMGSRLPLFLALRELGDVIAYDQRGTNESGPKMTCDGEQYMGDPSKPLSRASIAAMTDAVRRCAERLRREGVDINGYNTIENAADLDDLRKALGVPKLTLWGISYGTHLAAATLRYHPGAVERVILAGIEGPDDTYKLPSDQETLMEEIARLAPNPDLLGSINRLLAELEARPKSVSLTHPLNGQTATFVFGKVDLQKVLADMLFAPDSFAGMPDLVHRLERGDWLALGLLAGQARFGTAPSIMSVAMDCASGISAGRRQRIAEEAARTHLGDAINMPFPEVCGAVNVADAGDEFRSALKSNVPVLLISGTLDGRTRPRQAEELRMTMPNAEHLVLVGAGHSDPLFLSSPKILEAMKAFLRGERLRERYIELPKPGFLPLHDVATVSDAVLERYVGTYRVDAKTTRKVVKAGSVLYTIREGGQPLAIRPLSETEFFFEGRGGGVRFEPGAMVVRQADGSEARALRE